MVGLHRQQRGRREPAGLRTVLGRVPAEEVAGQRDNVLAPFPERRQMNLDGVQPEEQVLTEPTGGNLGPKIGIRRRDQAHVNATGLG